MLTPFWSFSGKVYSFNKIGMGDMAFASVFYDDDDDYPVFEVRPLELTPKSLMLSSVL